jgi:hypothetical protein
MSSPPTAQLNEQEQIQWLAGDVIFRPNWAAQNAPAGWNNNQPAIAILVATFLVKLELNLQEGSIQEFYNKGFKQPSVAKGFHQRESMFSFQLSGRVTICHLTVRLYNAKKTDYVTVHLYFTSDGRFAGATRWNEQTNQPWS